MSTTVTPLMSAEEFFNLEDRYSDNDHALELVRGLVVELPLSGKRHGFVCANVAAVLGNFAAQRKMGFVCSNGSGFIVERNPDSVLGPDIALFDEDVMMIADMDGFVSIAPRLVVEVLSTDDKPGPCLLRVKRFLNFGVDIVWLVDPDERTAIEFRRGKEHLVLGVEESLSGEGILPGLSCRVGEFFAMPGH